MAVDFTASRGATATHVSSAPPAAAARLLVPLAVAVGVALRITAYLSNPTLFIDETLLALNLILRVPTELFQPLDFEQIAPVSFSLAQHGVIKLAGAGEHALRLIPILCAVAVVITTPLVSRRFLSQRAVIVAACLIAFSPELLINSYRVKPYASDALVTPGVIALAFALGRRFAVTKSVILLGAAGIVAITFSLPAVFVLAGAWSWFAVRGYRERDTTALLALALAGTAWAATFYLLYTQIYRADPATNAYIDAFWRHSFVFSRADLAFPQQLTAFARGVFNPLFGRFGAPLTVALASLGFLIGVWALIRQRGVDALLVIVPLATAWLAYVVGLYVSVGRLFDFAAPLLAIVVAAGLEHAAGFTAIRWQSLMTALLTLPLFVNQLHGSALDLAYIVRDRGGAIRETLRVAQPHEPIYVYMRAIPNWVYYTTDWRAPDTQRVRRLLAAAASAGPNSGNASSPNRVVEREGYDRAYVFGERTEIMGIASGVVLGPDSVLKESADAGWGDNEIDRIMLAGKPIAWAVFWQEPQPIRDFKQAAARRGGCVTAHDELRLWLAVYKVEFPCRNAGVTERAVPTTPAR